MCFRPAEANAGAACPSCGKKINVTQGLLPKKCPFCKTSLEGIDPASLAPSAAPLPAPAPGPAVGHGPAMCFGSCCVTCDNCKPKFVSCPVCGHRNMLVFKTCRKCGKPLPEGAKDAAVKDWEAKARTRNKREERQ